MRHTAACKATVLEETTRSFHRLCSTLLTSSSAAVGQSHQAPVASTSARQVGIQITHTARAS